MVIDYEKIGKYGRYEVTNIELAQIGLKVTLAFSPTIFISARILQRVGNMIVVEHEWMIYKYN